jgi:hypothetical protein
MHGWGWLGQDVLARKVVVLLWESQTETWDTKAFQEAVCTSALSGFTSKG